MAQKRFELTAVLPIWLEASDFNNLIATAATFVSVYSKIPKYSDTRKIVVIILKFEQFGSKIEKYVQKMQTEWQTV